MIHSGPFMQYSIKRQEKLFWKESESFLESFPLMPSVGNKKSHTSLSCYRDNLKLTSKLFNGRDPPFQF